MDSMNDKKTIGLTTTVYHGHGFGIVQPGAPKPICPAEAIGYPQLGRAFVQLPAICLLLDILGFGRLMLKSKPVEVAGESAFFFETCFNSFSSDGFTEDELAELKSNFMRLSDTAALWSYTCESYANATSESGLEAKSLLRMLKVAQHLLVRGFQTKKYALRGSIAFGDCVQDARGGAIIGVPWTYASDLEKDQQWAGIALHPSAVALLTSEHRDAGLVTETKIPLKGGRSELGWAIDWRRSGIQRAEIEATFSRLGETGAIEQEKQRNTLAFLGV